MRLLRRARPRVAELRPAEPYLFAGAEEARRLGHNYAGTEHLLLVLVSQRDSATVRVLRQLDVSPQEVEEALADWVGSSTAKIDPDALAVLGIDFQTVRERLEQTFGPGALERTRTGCLGICPRAKMALAYALDHADGRPLGDEHVLLGMLSVPDSVAARVLAGFDVTLEAAAVIVADARQE